MRAFILLVMCTLITVQAFSQPLLHKSFWQEGDQQIQFIKPTNDGGYIAWLEYDYSLGMSGPVLVKTDADFNTTWSKLIGSGFSVPFDLDNIVQETADGGWLVFSGQSVLKLNETGEIAWCKDLSFYSYYGTFGSYSNYRKCIEKPNGKIVVMLTNYEDIKLVQLSSTGDYEWAKVIDGPSSGGKNPGFDMQALPDNSVIVTGKENSDNCFALVDNDGNYLWSRAYNCDDSYNHPKGVTIDEDGNILVVGMRFDYPYEDGFIMSLSITDGAILWHKVVKGMILEDVVALGDDKYAMLSKTGGDSYYDLDNNDLSLFVIDGNGNLFSSVTLPDLVATGIHSQFVSANGKTYVAGKQSSGADGWLSLVEIDKNLSGICNAEPLTPLMYNYTSLVTDLGGLYIAGFTVMVSSPAVITTTVSSTLSPMDLCEVFTPDVEITPENPFETNNINDSFNTGGIGAGTNENVSLPKINVYPNPSLDGQVITISFDQVVNAQLTLTDISGHAILKESFNGNAYRLNTNNLAKGMYLLNCKTPAGFLQTLKINIE